MILVPLLAAVLAAPAAQAPAQPDMMTYQMVLLKKGFVDDVQGDPEIASRSNSYFGSMRSRAPGIGAGTVPESRAPSFS
jgi:hypothetical protein